MLKIDNNTFNIEVSKNKKILPELNTGVVQQVHSDDFLQSTIRYENILYQENRPLSRLKKHTFVLSSMEMPVT